MCLVVAPRVAKVDTKTAPARGSKAAATARGFPAPAPRRHKTTVTRVAPKTTTAKARRTVKASAKRPARSKRGRKGEKVAVASTRK